MAQIDSLLFPQIAPKNGPHDAGDVDTVKVGSLVRSGIKHPVVFIGVEGKKKPKHKSPLYCVLLSVVSCLVSCSLETISIISMYYHPRGLAPSTTTTFSLWDRVAAQTNRLGCCCLLEGIVPSSIERRHVRVAGSEDSRRTELRLQGDHFRTGRLKSAA